MGPDSARRAELADFLKTRRAALSPEAAGLAPDGSRRRTPGLRREEVAQLAGVGLSWYTWLEQGREITPSEQVLRALGRALRLTPGEREHLTLLAAPVVAGSDERADEEVDEGTVAVIHGLVPHPAFVLGPRFDVVAHNRAAEVILADLVSAPKDRRNVLLWLFSWENDRPGWERTARANLRDFRTEFARHPGDAAYEELVAELIRRHESVRVWWAEHGVEDPEPMHKVIPHRDLGPLAFLQMQSRPSHRPALRVRVLVPADERTRTVLSEI
ncbi:helix-turn-helix transcriptional regulator [Actinoplanes sp. NPDC051494]|uniref:helix-turn-helix transcriptional regulator n=1 Tax=Actinoplanes sp. NPDC051494 TaxID=3363907 RepID=UPI0037B31499